MMWQLCTALRHAARWHMHGVGRRGIAHGLELDVDDTDARAIDLAHGEAEAVVGDHVARTRRAAELAEQKAADRRVVFVRQATAEALVEVLDAEGGLEPHAVGSQTDDLAVRQVELVVDLADDLLQEILERDDAAG